MYRSSIAYAVCFHRGVVLTTILSAALVFMGGTALGSDEDVAAAKAHFAAGLQHFNLSEFEQALAEFKESYRSKSDPVFLYNIGQCHRKLGHVEEAITFYRSYLREAPDAKNRREVERRIEELEALRDAESASITSSSTASPGPSPVSQAAQERAVAEGSSPAPAMGVDFGARADAPAPAAKPVYKRWWFWAATGAVAVGATAVGIVLARRDPTSVPESTLGAQRAMP